MIHYRIQPSKPEAHLFTVTVTVPEPTPEGQAFSLPAWIPGSYMIREFARNIVRFEAVDSEQQPISWLKLDKHTWQLEPADGPVSVSIDVYAWDLSVRMAHLDTLHGYFNGTSVFLAAKGHEDKPCLVDILPPQGEAYADWQLATGMPRVSGEELSFGQFKAANYDALIDYPVEMGPFTHGTFMAKGVPHHIVLSGRHQADLERLKRDLTAICSAQIELFGTPAPMDNYWFLNMVVGEGYGGLEHRNSTSLLCSRNDLPLHTDKADEVRAPYRNYLGLCSHEYFHTWNVKRIKPEAFTPYDLSQENYTELLWAFEGITSYYDELMLARSEVITPESYLELLGQNITRVYRGMGRLKQTVTESSFDAWTRFYLQDENAPNAIVSYYSKGALVALALDLTLRQRSNNKVSLDHVMRTLWQRYGQTGVGVPEQGIQPVAEELLGESLASFFEQALYSTEDLPLEALLAEQGVHLHWRSANSHQDTGGTASAHTNRIHLGIRPAADALGVRIQSAFEQGAAMAAGLSAGDIIVAIDGLKTDMNRLEQQLSAYLPGETVTVHAFRRDELLTFNVELRADEATTAYLTFTDDSPNKAAQAWLFNRS